MELQRWFYYKLSAVGKWCPQKSVDEPREKTLGGRQKLGRVEKLDDDEAAMDIRDLAERYPMMQP